MRSTGEGPTAMDIYDTGARVGFNAERGDSSVPPLASAPCADGFCERPFRLGELRHRAIAATVPSLHDDVEHEHRWAAPHEDRPDNPRDDVLRSIRVKREENYSSRDQQPQACADECHAEHDAEDAGEISCDRRM